MPSLLPHYDLTQHTTLHRNERWLSAWVGDEMMMMDGDTGSCLSLSSTAGRIWELLERPATFAELVAAMEGEYQAEHADVVAAVQAFVRQMLEEDIFLVEPMHVC